MHGDAQVRIRGHKLHADPNGALPSASFFEDKPVVKILRNGFRGLTPDLSKAGTRDPGPRL